MIPAVAHLLAKLAVAAVLVAAAVLLILRLGVQKARRMMAEQSVERAGDANEIDERVRGASDAELDELFRRSQE